MSEPVEEVQEEKNYFMIEFLFNLIPSYLFIVFAKIVCYHHTHTHRQQTWRAMNY